jgi:endonuclease/exonuclease/phosphatase family metal-dependent hydrolase
MRLGLVVGCARTINLLDPAVPRFSGEYASLATDLSARPVRIVTFNIKLARRIDRAIEMLRSDSLRDADIVALEEMDDTGVDRIAGALGLNYVYYPGSIHPTDHNYFGPAVLSRWPIERSWKLLVPDGR